MNKLMNRKVLVVGLVMVVAFLNTWLAKYIHPTVQLPETVAEEVADYVLPEDSAVPDISLVYLVTHIVDGDTIDVDINGEVKRVRYIGIDTPESVKLDQPVGCFGKEASERNRQLVEGKMVRLERDVSDVDKYGRLLRYVYVGDEFVNLKLVTEGYAKSVTFPPDVTKASIFLAAEQAARSEKIGLWGNTCAGN